MLREPESGHPASSTAPPHAARTKRDSSRKAAGTGLRKVAAGTGVAAAVLLTAAATTTPALAAPAPKPKQPLIKVTDGANGAKTITVVGRAATAARAVPTTSPVVQHTYLKQGEHTTCPSGYACAAVPYSTGAYVFKFYEYGGYSLSYWGGTSEALNNQTGGAAMRLDNVNGTQVRCIAPPAHVYDADWDPIWRIRLTASSC